jgi:hypothetical protein
LALNLAADFIVANRGITSQTVTAGHPASYINDIGVNPFFGFAGTVTVSCTVPAQATTCSVTPNSYSLANGAGWGTLTVTTTARTSAFWRNLDQALPFHPAIWSSLVMLLLCATLVPWSQSRQRSFRRRLAFSLLPLVMLAAGLVACGSGGGSGSTSGGGGPPPPPPTGTAAGTYTVTVTGSSDTSTHTTTLTLVVQ